MHIFEKQNKVVHHYRMQEATHAHTGPRITHGSKCYEKQATLIVHQYDMHKEKTPAHTKTDTDTHTDVFRTQAYTKKKTGAAGRRDRGTGHALTKESESDQKRGRKQQQQLQQSITDIIHLYHTVQQPRHMYIYI